MKKEYEKPQGEVISFEPEELLMDNVFNPDEEEPVISGEGVEDW